MPDRLIRHSKGFTLVEVLISVVILAFGLMLIIEGMGRSEQAIRVGENLVHASHLAENALEESMIEVIQHRKQTSGNFSGKKQMPGRVFEWTKSVRPFSHPSLKDETKLNQIQVEVSWSEGFRKNKQTFETLILNREKTVSA